MASVLPKTEQVGIFAACHAPVCGSVCQTGAIAHPSWGNTMPVLRIAVAASCLWGVVANAAWAAGPTSTAPATAAAVAIPQTETALRQAMQEAVWPADIVRHAADYLRQHPTGAWADAARALHERASAPTAVLTRSDVRLFRS